MSRTLRLRVEPLPDALDRFEAAWHLAAGLKPPEPLAVLAFDDLPELLKTLTPARWALLAQLKKSGPLSVYALARILGRDYKNVHTDVKQLAEIGLVERRSAAEVAVPWDAVRADLRL